MKARRGEILTEWGTSAESAIQTDRINETSDLSEAHARMKPRLQRVVFEIGRIPGALPQAVMTARLWR